MPTIREGALTFHFPEGAIAGKYDDWSYYRNHFQSFCGGSKAVDLVYVANKIAWLIEVKDYRQNPRTKAVDLADEIVCKVRDTLAGLVGAIGQANDPDERRCAKAVIGAQQLRIVCHLEQPARQTRLRPRAIEPDKLVLQLRQRLKAVDPHPMVVDSTSLRPGMDWSVSCGACQDSCRLNYATNT